MTEQGPNEEAAAPRHRRSGPRDLADLLATALQPGRRAFVVTGALVLVLMALVVGHAIVNSPGSDPGTPPAAAPGGAPPSAPPAGSTAPAASSTPSTPATSAPATSTPATGADRTSAPPGRTAEPTRHPEPRLKPRRVGPAGIDGFQKLLADFCVKRGDRTAELLEGPNGNPATGNWACVRVVTFTNINLDEACRAKFGDDAQARQTTRGDSRTWRCFDS